MFRENLAAKQCRGGKEGKWKCSIQRNIKIELNCLMRMRRRIGFISHPTIGGETKLNDIMTTLTLDVCRGPDGWGLSVVYILFRQEPLPPLPPTWPHFYAIQDYILKRIFCHWFPDDCVSNPSLCAEGLSVAFWLKFFSGQYIISSGRGASRFATGFDFYRESADGDFKLILETQTKEWSLKVNDIPKVFFLSVCCFL